MLQVPGLHLDVTSREGLGRWGQCREREGPSVARRREAGLEGHVWKQGVAGPISAERRPSGGQSAPEGT